MSAVRHQVLGATFGESFWYWALGAYGGHGHAQPPFRSSRLIGAERQPTSDCRQSLQQSPADAQLDDEFPDGEQHYRIPLDRAEVVEAFTLSPEGQRVPLAGTVTVTRAASFPAAPQARDVTVSQARPTQPAAGPRGPELGVLPTQVGYAAGG